MQSRNVRAVFHGAAAAVAVVIGLSVAGRADAANVLIDFGDAAAPTNTDAVGRAWNNVNQNNDVSGSPFALNGTGGTDSGYRMTVSNPPGVTNPVGFNGNNNNGTTSPTGTALARNYPATATQDSMYGNTVSFNNLVVQATRLTLSNLNPNETYAFDFFASRTGTTDNRETEYLVTGAKTATAYLNAANNTGNIAGVADIRPDANNQIVIDIDPGPNNTNANRFFYLGVLEVNSSPVPEPASLALAAVGATALLGRRRRRQS